MTRKLVPFLVVLFVMALAPGASAITYGQPDGELHPNVGALVGTFEDGTRPYCSGSLASPTVFVTAAHCDIGTSTVCVTFDSVYSSRSKLHCGAFRPSPAYGFSQENPNDVAVVQFQRRISRIAPVQLPETGLLDSMKAAGTLDQSTAFTSVGYGLGEAQPAPGGHTFEDGGVRRYATGYFNALGPGYVRISQNPNNGSAGTCYGDSGGPIFLGGPSSNLVTAITTTGDVFCKATNTAQRLDVQSVRSFLASFGV